jgi:hypothetical protein
MREKEEAVRDVAAAKVMTPIGVGRKIEFPVSFF